MAAGRPALNGIACSSSSARTGAGNTATGETLAERWNDGELSVG